MQGKELSHNFGGILCYASYYGSEGALLIHFVMGQMGGRTYVVEVVPLPSLLLFRIRRMMQNSLISERKLLDLFRTDSMFWETGMLLVL